MEELKPCKEEKLSYSLYLTLYGSFLMETTKEYEKVEDLYI